MVRIRLWGGLIVLKGPVSMLLAILFIMPSLNRNMEDFSGSLCC